MVLLARLGRSALVLRLTSQGISGREVRVANVRLAAIIERHVEHVILGVGGLFQRFSAIENIGEDLAGLLSLRVAILAQDALGKENSEDDAEDSEGADDDFDAVVDTL